MKDTTRPASGFYDPQACDLREFEALIAQTTTHDMAPHAARIVQNVPVYDMADLRPMLSDPDARRVLMAEWAAVLNTGPGVVALHRTYEDTAILDRARAVYDRIIDRERRESGGGADHFATAGANDRIWNSAQKLCEAAPEIFLHYFANPTIAAICEAWLGPNYQVTAQVNQVRPGGAAQQAHRDYHLGFQTADVSASYPAHVHDVSPILTLQGAIAHCDMPVESGPTKLLPFSQAYRPGYAAWRRADFRALFEERHVQLPLHKGDTLFFNPALFHAGGANSSADIMRFVNLLQVSSAFGRAMEAMDRDRMCRLVFPHAAKAQGSLDAASLDAAIAATAEGYSFPTNLDRDPPANGLAPETQADFFRRAIREGMDAETFGQGLDRMAAARRP